VQQQQIKAQLSADEIKKQNTLILNLKNVDKKI